MGASNGWEQAMSGSKLWVGARCVDQSMIFDHFRSSFSVISVCGLEHDF